MKKKLMYITTLFLIVILSVFACSCDVGEQSSVKTITKPYINEYECTYAQFGDENILEKYDYIKIILTDKENAELVYKPKNGDRRIIKSTYTYNSETKELTANIGIYGHEYKPTVTIKDGEFTVNKSFMQKQLTMKFKAK